MLPATKSNDTFAQNSPTTWQSGPQKRGGLDVLFNCLLSIIACTYTIQYLNDPAPRDGILVVLYRNFIWAFITLIFPEFIFMHACVEFKMALDNFETLHLKFMLQETLNKERLLSEDARNDPERLPELMTRVQELNKGLNKLLPSSPEWFRSILEAMELSLTSGNLSDNLLDRLKQNLKEHLNMEGYEPVRPWGRVTAPWWYRSSCTYFFFRCLFKITDACKDCITM